MMDEANSNLDANLEFDAWEIVSVILLYVYLTTVTFIEIPVGVKS